MDQSITTEYVRFPSKRPDHQVRAYLARPSGPGPFPALLDIHEWTGLTPYCEDVARRLAREGYLALAPDMYTDDPEREAFDLEDMEDASPLGRAPDLEAALLAFPEEQRPRIMRIHKWRTGRPGNTYVPDLQGCMDYLRQRPDVISSAIGAIGFCMGGRLAMTLATTGADLAAIAPFYGPNPPLADVPNIKCPVQGHYGSEDPAVTLKIPELEAAMRAANKDFTYFVYDGAQHAFHNDQRHQSFHPEAARISWERALEFLNQHVKQPVAAR